MRHCARDGDVRPRVPPGVRPTGRRDGSRMHDHHRRRSGVPRRFQRCDRLLGRARPRRDRVRHGRPGERRRLRARHAILHERGRTTGPPDRRVGAGRRRSCVPREWRQRGQRNGAQVGALLPRRPWRSRPARRAGARGRLPRQQPRRARRIRSVGAASGLRAVAGPNGPCADGEPVPRPADRSRTRRRTRSDDSRHRFRPDRRLDRRADQRSHPRCGGAARRLLAGRRTGVPRSRRAADPRRGDDRVRAYRHVVRRRSLGAFGPT